MGKATEIELKAHVYSPDDCSKRLIALAGKGTAFFKDDTYWYFPAASENFSGLRVRQEKTGETEYGKDPIKTLITWKNKERQNGIEINQEHEIAIAGEADSVDELFIMFGLEKKIFKYKKGWSWQYRLTELDNPAKLDDPAAPDGKVTVELCEVHGGIPANFKNLGWFLELEIVLQTEQAGSETTAAARDLLMKLLEKAGIGKENIEPQYYSELLTRN